MQHEWRYIYRSFRRGSPVSDSKVFDTEKAAWKAAKAYVARNRDMGGFAAVWAGRIEGGQFNAKQHLAGFGEPEDSEAYCQAGGA